jgi:hypothetical protein
VYRDRGFFIALESFDNSPSMRLLGEHLASNIAAYMALKDFLVVPTSLLVGHEDRVEDGDEFASSALFDEVSEVVFDPIEGFVMPRDRVTEALDAGRIVIADRFLHHVDRVIPHAHLSLPVERLLFSGDTQADCVVFLERVGHQPGSELAEHASAVMREMAKSRPNVHVVAIEDEHVHTCDAVWRSVKPCLKPWLLSHGGGAG